MLAIIADDLTGALDSAAPFAGRGLHTELALQPEAINAALVHKPEVLSINTGSREMPAEAAGNTIRTVLSLLPDGTTIFKKVDSRLKGNIVSEMEAIPFRSALVAPGIPDFGRIVRSGHLQGFGVDMPIQVADRLGHHSKRCHIPDTLDHQQMLAALCRAQADGMDLLVGARGLAEALAQKMTGRTDGKPAQIPAGPALFVIGSRDPITLAQVDEARYCRDLQYLAAPNGSLLHEASSPFALRIVQATPGDNPATPEEVSQNLARSVHPQLTRSVRTLLLSGGATAEAVLLALGISRMRLGGECLPGLGLAHSQGYCIIAKSGGFGQRDTLKTLANMILERMG